jgi:hypothetical protein
MMQEHQPFQHHHRLQPVTGMKIAFQQEQTTTQKQNQTHQTIVKTVRMASCTDTAQVFKATSIAVFKSITEERLLRMLIGPLTDFVIKY